MNKHCIYCDQHKPVEEFSREHIFPDALGGDSFPEFFKSERVCRNCNSLCGLFVDGPFVRSYFVQNERALAWMKYVDLKTPTHLPMHYMGPYVDIELPDNQVCEMWLGPHGGVAYHVHEKLDETKFGLMIGSNPILAKKRGGNGTVFIAPQDADNYWNHVFLLSVRKLFANARRIAVNMALADPKQHAKYFDEATPEESELVKYFLSAQGSMHKFELSFDLACEERFLAKYALGLGHSLLGDAYLGSELAKKYRQALWEKDPKERDKIGLRFDSILGDDNKIDGYEQRVFCVPGIHTATFLAVRGNLFGILYLFGNKKIIVLISDAPELWSGQDHSLGCYFVAPQLQRCSGKIELQKVISAINGHTSIPFLEEIKAYYIEPGSIPPIGVGSKG